MLCTSCAGLPRHAKAPPSRQSLRHWRPDSTCRQTRPVKLSTTSSALEDLEAWSTNQRQDAVKDHQANRGDDTRAGAGKPERFKHLGGEVRSRRSTEKDQPSTTSSPT